MNPVLIVVITVCAASVITVTAFIICRKINQRKHESTTARLNLGYQSTENTVYTVPTNPSPYFNNLANNINPRSHQYDNNRPGNNNSEISQNGDMFQVPLELIPASFDYNVDGVVRKGNYVLIKDLSMIERRNSEPAPNREEYLTQQPYNPNYLQY